MLWRRNTFDFVDDVQNGVIGSTIDNVGIGFQDIIDMNKAKDTNARRDVSLNICKPPFAQKPPSNQISN